MESQVRLLLYRIYRRADLFIDTLKGSYYANPLVDSPDVSAQDKQSYPEYYGENICMKLVLNIYERLGLITTLRYPGPAPDEAGVEGFEEAFKDLGRFVYKVGRELAAACQPFGSCLLHLLL